MRQIINLLSLLIVSMTAQAQKIKQTKNGISVDKKDCLLIEKEGWQTYTLSTLDGEEICFVSWVQESPRETH